MSVGGTERRGPEGGVRSPWSGRPAALLVLAAGLLLVVAVGTRGSPSGSVPVPSTAGIWETAFYALAGLMAGVGLVALPIALLLGRRRGGFYRKSTPRQLIALALTWLALLGGLFVYALLAHPAQVRLKPPPPLRSSTGGVTLPLPTAHAASGGPTVVLAVSLLVGIVLSVLVVLAPSALSHRRRADPPVAPQPEPPASLEMVDAAVEALGSEADPRRAVIAAYATMERLLDAAGSPRRAADAPTEHLERSLVHLGAAHSSARRLTDLFERARFSVHTIDEPVRQVAFEALAAVRRDLERPPEMAR